MLSTKSKRKINDNNESSKFSQNIDEFAVRQKPKIIFKKIV